MTARTGPELGVPVGRFLELSLDTNKRAPYEITDKISVIPPTKTRTQQMADARGRIVVFSAGLQAALKSPASTPEQLNELSVGVQTAETDYNQAFFGDAYESVMAFFADRDITDWEAFVKDIREYFTPSIPADGTCQTCGQLIDEAQAGKAPKSSIG